MSDFWKRVDEELNYKGQTRAYLVKKCGISPASFTLGLERSSCPAADTALKIADALGVSVQYLVNGTKSPASAKNDQNTQEELRLSRKYRRLLEQCETLSPQKTELLSLIADNLEK